MFDGKLTIVEHKINQTKSEKWLCSINSYFDLENGQLSNIKLIELNQEGDYVRLMLSNYIKGFVPRSKKKTTTDSSVGFFGREFFRDNFLNGIFLNQSFLPKSSLAT